MSVEITVNMGEDKEKDMESEDMADKGRGGDSVMGHLTPGEVVIPVDMAQKMMPQLQKAFAAMDYDITQYIVGHPNNSINPETGCAEFLSLKKIVRAVTKPITSVVSAVAKPIVGVVNKVDNALGLNLIPDAPKDTGPTAEETAALKRMQDEEAAYKKQSADFANQQKLLDAEMVKQKESAAAESAKIKTQSDVIKRESDERKLARLRSRRRSLTRPMLASSGVSLKG